jgi:branched-chain amino acid transport system substrate-binding protein
MPATRPPPQDGREETIEEMTEQRGGLFSADVLEERVDRAKLLRRAGAATLALGLAPYVATTRAYASARTIKIGWVAPLTGPLASFGEANRYTVSQMQKLFSKGIRAGKNTYPVEILLRDSQSNTNRGASVAQSLILDDNVDLMLVSSTPLTTNPVSDVCEANGMPCVVTDVPWQAWFFGRKGNPAKPFKWTYQFFWGLEDIIAVFMDMWSQVPTNKSVGALYPNDPDGAAWADKKLGFPPVLAKGGFRLDNPGLYPEPNDDFSSHLSAFKKSNAQIVTGVPLPPDFVTFWKQALQQGFRPKVASIARALLFPTDIQALGKDGAGMSTEVWWHPGSPYHSSLTKQSAAALAAQWTRQTKKQWTQPIGSSHALFEVAASVLARTADVDSKESIVAAIKETKLNTVFGLVTWKGGRAQNPVANCSKTKLAGGQWRKGKKYPYEMVVVSNKRVPGLKREGKLQPIVYR